MEKKDTPWGAKVGTIRRLAADYAGGMRTRDLQKLVEQDVVRALDVLAGDRQPEDCEHAGLGRWPRRVGLAFLGMSLKLSPARRLVLALAVLAAILGLFDLSFKIQGRASLAIDSSPFWFLTSIVFLLALLALELVDRLRVRDELQVARQLQRDLLPSGTVELPAFEVHHAYRTANEVGGDFYDFATLPDGRIVLMIGDASGHGIAAGLLMATAKAALGVAVDLDPSPEKVLSVLNRSLLKTGDRRSFMTLFYGVVDPVSGGLEYACAGHPFPLLRRGGGEVEELGQGGLPLGLRAGLEFESGRTRLEAGDLLLLYTDGLPEAVAADGKEAFGFPRLQALVAAAPSAALLVERSLAALESHLGEESLRDDVSLAALEYRGV
ncbi:MAG: SpoIIE family protein phosphatase [Acidobacteria bacterium]|nr:SpoIIE family protein phosphatase [Acidobacteriota bacterium]